MPYCPACDYWIVGRKRHFAKKACPNCGNYPFLHLTDDVEHEAGPRAFISKYETQLFSWGAILAAFCGLWGLGRFPILGTLILAGGIGLARFYFQRWRRITVSASAAKTSQKAMFQNLRNNLTDLRQHIVHLKELRETEVSGGRAPRGLKRIEMLDAVIKNRETKISLLGTELWARDIQLWLNRLEGFLTERLGRLNRENGGFLLGEFRSLMMAGEELRVQAKKYSENSALGRQAKTLLDTCLSKAPEFEDRVMDARVLAAVADPELPVELSEGETWLHWIQNALPNLDSLPEVLKVDEEYHRINAELRLLKDTLKLAPPPSLDESVPSAMSLDPASQTS